ncbi:hypothetical protein DWU98_02825 [Dyella monticola]|uniref:Uncharacterized protein n=1 Tax=Dyella monticola TaxID=1927958 RepID=A0A370X967_9GAMM|nr:hypothetical protein [Dyella monticola]RDS84906.1 hypothetical protein DWU98_02825 [Dyella monticola]
MDWQNVIKIQQSYLKMLDGHYQAQRKALLARQTPDTVLQELSAVERTSRLRDFLRDCRDFWAGACQPLESLLTAGNAAKICLWADSGVEALLPRMGLYFDVALIPDTFAGSYTLDPDAKDFPAGYDVEALKWLSIVDAIRPGLTDAPGHPMVLFFPQRLGLQDNSEEVGRLMRSAGTLAAYAFPKLLRLDDSDIPPNQILDYLQRVDVSKVNKNGSLRQLHPVIEPLLGRATLPRARANGINSSLLRRLSEHGLKRGDLSKLFSLFGTQLYMSEVRQYISSLLRADDVVTQALQPALHIKERMLARESRLHELTQDKVVARSFQHHMPWLSGLTLGDCMMLREDPLFGDVRKLFTVSEDKLRHASVDDLETIAADVEQQVANALQEHELKIASSLQMLHRKTTNHGLSLSAGAGLGLASLVFPQVTALAVASLLAGVLLGTESVYGLIKTRSDLKNNVESLQNNPISVLLRAKKYGLGNT